MTRIAGLALAAAAAIMVATSAQAGGQKILSIVTSENNEAQAMALVLANQAQAAGNPVQVLLCGPAGDIALADPPEAATAVVTPKGMSVRTLLGGLIKKGGKVDVCAIYLPNRKLAKDALMADVGVAKPPAIAAMMADPAVKVIGQ